MLGLKTENALTEQNNRLQRVLSQPQRKICVVTLSKMVIIYFGMSQSEIRVEVLSIIDQNAFWQCKNVTTRCEHLFIQP